MTNNERPTSEILAGARVFLVADVVAASDYYRDALGFRYDRFWGEPPDFCMVWRDDCCVMLSRVDDPSCVRPASTVKPSVWDAYFWVDDVDRLYAELTERGARLQSEPFDKPYGCRELVAVDLDGYQLAFGQDLDAA